MVDQVKQLFSHAYHQHFTDDQTAMGEMTRTWVIPASSSIPELEFEIREPPLTGDNLGLKTWGTAYAMSKSLENLKTRYLNSLFSCQMKSVDSNAGDASNVSVLELGAGTGLVGIAAAAIWSAHVVLTDLEEIQPNLDFNIEKNFDTVSERGGLISGAVLDWKDSEKGFAGTPSKKFDVSIFAL